MIEIKHNGSVLFKADVGSIKLAIEAAIKGGANLRGASLCGADLRGADLYGADLYGADLRDASLRGADLRGASLRGADLCDADLYGADLRDADLRGVNLYDADLRGANLRDADLRGADLCGADLRGASLYDADLRGAKNYTNSHSLFFELIRLRPVKTFTDNQWSIIGKISIHRWCWDTLKKEFGDDLTPIFQILANSGFNEYLNHYKSMEN